MNPRYFVPDLAPYDRDSLSDLKPQWLFIAESPHISEVEASEREGRRPLCGAAGRQWWSALSEILEGRPNSDVSLERLVLFSRKHRIVVGNAVQYPLDSKVTRLYPDADPILHLGFDKSPGSTHYKKFKGAAEMERTLESLRDRVNDSRVRSAPIVCLGNDAEWFVLQALGREEFRERVYGRLPHPSAWWRRGGYFGNLAREELKRIFEPTTERPSIQQSL